MKIGTAARNAIVDAFCALLDGGTITIRTGAAPTNPSDADSGTLLATLGFSSPAFGASSSGTATANAISSDTSVDASGTAAHFRMKSSGGTCHAQGTVNTSGGDMNFNTVAFVAGGTCSISSLTVTQPTGS